MAGTVEGGKKAYKTNITKHGKNFYSIIGQKGGRAGNTGGFYALKQQGRTDEISRLGSIGGKKSKRRKNDSW